MKIKSITIEGMHNVAEKTYTFNDLNYLYGSNGAGKSTALQAIQLALLGYIPGVDKRNEALIGHAKGKMLSVTCIIDDDGKEIKINRSLVGSGRSITKTCDIQPEGIKMEDILSDIELPIYNFSDFLDLTANKMKEWFINFLPSTDGQINWEQQLTESLQDLKVIDSDLLPDTLDAIKQFPSTGVDHVKDVNAYLKELTSLLKGNLQRTQATIQSLIFYDDCDSAPDSEVIESELRELNDNLSKAARAEAVRSMNEKIKSQIAQIHVSAACIDDDAEYADLCKEVQELKDQMLPKLQSELNDIMDKKSELTAKNAELNATIKSKSSIISSKGVCPFTCSECVPIKELIEELEAEVNQATAEINQNAAKLQELTDSYKVVDSSMQSAQSTIASKEKAIIQIQAAYTQLGGLRSQLQMEELVDGQEANVEQMRSRIAELQTLLSKVAANARYNSLIDSLTAEKYKIENSIEVIKIWTKLTDANGLQTSMMAKPFELLANDMNSYLQKMFNKKDISTHFNLSEKANSFSFGMLRDEKYITFDMLSSGEKCLYTLALMMCIISRSTSALKVIMIDDLLDHLDDTNASKLFEALYKIKDIQIILAGVKECKSSCKDAVVIEVK